MTRKILALALAGGNAKATAAWTRLGFVLDGGGLALADGATLDLIPAGAASLVGLSGEADAFLSDRPRAISGENCLFALARPRDARAPLHPNGALGLKSVAFLAEDPADHAEALSKITGQREMLATSAGLEMSLGGGPRLLVLTPAAFAFHYGGLAPENAAFRLAGLTFAVATLGATEKMLHSNGASTRCQAGRLLPGEAQCLGEAQSLGKAQSLGAALAFEAN